MKISRLLASRPSLLRQTVLANQAHGYHTLRRLAARIARVPMHGWVSLVPASPEHPCITLTAQSGVAQSVLEEHFSDRDLLELSDALMLALDREFESLSFDLSTLGTTFLPVLREQLARAGVDLDLETEAELPPASDSRLDQA